MQRNLDHLGAKAVRVGAQRGERVRVQTRGDDEATPTVVQLRHVRGGRNRGGPLVHRGVGHRQAGELADGRLVLEHHLQPPLRDLRLVGGVGSEELRALHQHVDQRRHVVVVHSGAQETQLVLGANVARGQLAQVRVHLLLGQPRRQLQLAAQAHGLRDLPIEQLLHGAHADRREHRGKVLGSGGGVAGHPPLSVACGPDQPLEDLAASAVTRDRARGSAKGLLPSQEPKDPRLSQGSPRTPRRPAAHRARRGR